MCHFNIPSVVPMATQSWAGEKHGPFFILGGLKSKLGALYIAGTSARETFILAFSNLAPYTCVDCPHRLMSEKANKSCSSNTARVHQVLKCTSCSYLLFCQFLVRTISLFILITHNN